jgi:two-component system, LuxR family, response regulator FixJ
MGTRKRTIILVLDDDEAVRESLKFFIELEGYAVHACAAGGELLKHPDLTRAHCLILDYKMPQMDGFEVLDRLARQHVEMPVILITSHASEALRRQARRRGVRQIIEKPLSDGALMDNIQSLLGD